MVTTLERRAEIRDLELTMDLKALLAELRDGDRPEARAIAMLQVELAEADRCDREADQHRAKARKLGDWLAEHDLRENTRHDRGDRIAAEVCRLKDMSHAANVALREAREEIKLPLL